ncbi:MAG: hypothetical protein M1817_003893 [Caeruleum heppii]|nr:MAG: hypothetical protein M1817_003893 [Caeruleum heppii]
MSRPLAAFYDFLIAEGRFAKLFGKHTPGKRIVPAQAGDNDAKHQLRLDAGETINGRKTVYLQVNAQAKNDALKEFRKKHGSHANLATGSIDPNTPEDQQKVVFREFWTGVKGEAREKLG